MIRDTCAGVPRTLLEESSYCYAEISIIERLVVEQSIEPTRLVPMVSAFLGAKTRLVKLKELEYAQRCSPGGRVLYFFDAKNVRFGEMEAFADELQMVAHTIEPSRCTLYLPFAFFEMPELRAILGTLSRTSFPILLSFEEAAAYATVDDILDLVLQYRGSESMGCLFHDHLQLDEATEAADAHGVREVVFYT